MKDCLYPNVDAQSLKEIPKRMRLTYIYFLIAVTQVSHDFRFDMGRMGIRAGKLTSPEFFDKEVLVLLVRNMCESFDKNGKFKCAHKCFTQSKGFIL